MNIQGGEGRRKGKFRCRCVVGKGGEEVLLGAVQTHLHACGWRCHGPPDMGTSSISSASLGQAIGGSVVLGVREMLHLGRKV